MAYQWITKIPYQREGLFEKFANPDEGWRISNGQISFDVPLGKLDAAAYRILASTIENNKHIVIALPRVKTGVSLSIIAYLVVNRLIKQSGRTLKDFLPISLDNAQNIIIATQNRKLRDFFLLSSLRFANTDFPFTYFPIYRLNHAGDLIPLVTRNESKGQISLNPIVFYHLDELESYPQSLENGCLLGELIETNSPDLAKKICRFINAVHINSSLLLINQFSENTLSVLRENSFHIITFGIRDILEDVSSNNQENLPSLCSSLTTFPKSIILKLHLIEDKTIDTNIANILAILLSLNKKFYSNKPRLLIKAWGIFYLLKDLCVPLYSFELHRKRNPWLRTIKFSIQQTFQFPLNKLDESSQSILAPIWGTLESEFCELYNYLEKKNPKYDYLLGLLNDSKNDTCSAVFSSRGQTEVLKEELLLKKVGKEEENANEVSVSFINDLINNSESCKDMLLSGIWKRSDEPKIFSLLPHKINVICYSSELPAMPSLLYRVNKKNITEWSSETSKSLKFIQFNINVNDDTMDSDWLTPDSDSQFFIDYFKEFTPQTQDELPDLDKYDWLSVPVDENEEGESDVQNISNEEETIPAYKVVLENDRTIFIPTDQEVMVYSEDGEIQSKLSEALEPGDIILLYSQEQNREMFESVLQRTQELSRVDPRIMSIWKTALKTLREKYDINNHNSLKVYLSDLKQNNCTKTEQAAKMWLRGVTLAPRDQVDIECLLNLTEYKNIAHLSRLIHREIENIRVFHRILGKRLKEKLGSLIRGKRPQQTEYKEPIDREIDEILEMAEPIAIKDISKDIKYVQKNELRINVFG